MTRQEYRDKLYNKLRFVDGFVDVEVGLKGVGEDREYEVFVYHNGDIDSFEVWDLVGMVTFKRANEEMV